MQTTIQKSLTSFFSMLFFSMAFFAQAQTPFLLKDINTSTVNSSPRGMINVNGTVFFSAEDGVHGRELWKSSGTEATTVLIKDINPAGNSNPANFCNVNGTVFFTANDGSGIALWKTNGTTQGTVKVKDVFNQAVDDQISQLTACGGKLFFSALAQTNLPAGVIVCPKLYVSDGTANGTQVLGFSVFNPQNLTSVGSILFFSAAGSPVNNNIELFRTNGTELSTMIVTEINPNGAISEPRNLVNVNGTLFFSANNGVNRQIWKSNGTAAGTIKMTNTNFGFQVEEMAHINGTVFFAGVIQTPIQNTTGNKVFRLNALNNITEFNTAGSKNLTPFANNMVFVTEGQLGTSISRVSPNGNQFTDIKTFSVAGLPSSLRVAGSTLFFVAGTNDNGRELWKTDGNTATMVQDFVSGPSNAFISDMCARSNDVLFASNGPGGNELRRSTGALNAIQTVRIIRHAGSNPTEFVKMGAFTYFAADNGINGRELWKTDGNIGNATLVADIITGSNGSNPTNLIVVTNAAGVQTLFFVAQSPSNGRELFKLENTLNAAPIRISDIIVGAGNAGIGNMTNVNGTLHFTATQGLPGLGDRIFRVNVGRTNVETTGGPMTAVSNLVAMGSTLFFTQSPQVGGRILNKLVNGATSTIRTFAVPAGLPDPVPQQLTVIGSRLFFSAGDGQLSRRLWITNTTATNASVISTLEPSDMTNFNGRLVFTAPTGFIAGQRSIFRVNTALTGVENLATGIGIGTLRAAGTNLFFLQPLQQGMLEMSKITTISNNIVSLKVFPEGNTGVLPECVVAGNNLYFNMTSADTGNELWKTNGTAIGTVLVSDIRPGVGNSNIQSIRVCGTDLFFSANNGTTGQEPWNLANATATQGDESEDREEEVAEITADTPVAADIKVYPNPATDFVSVDISANEMGGALQLFSASGQLVRNASMAEGETVVRLDLQDLPKGVYLVRWEQEDGPIVTKKVILQ
ncbi:MAG: T9SS type A sorting domain-containing protein [Saprospiraceae bacterium]|nr:T9SS type A sorting domain-containing protein [Saprospiraceae bacterium]